MWTKTCAFSTFAFFLCVMVQYKVVYAKRILFIANIPSYSHQITYRGLLLELNRQGYEIVAVTTDPIKNSSLTNYKEIDLHHFYKGFPDVKDVMPYNGIFEARSKLSFLNTEIILWNVIHILNREVFKHPEVKKLYAANSDEHFDAVIIAQGPTASLNAFAYRFNAPLIGISSLDVFSHLRYTFGSVILPSHDSHWETNTLIDTNNISFWRRLVNFLEVWTQIYYWQNVCIPKEDAITKKYLGEDTPHVDDITRNMSIFLVNRHPLFTYRKPEQPNLIYYHGFHITKTPPALPENVKQFLDDAKEGFIYVSLGTNVKWKDLPNKAFEAFLEVFSTLPCKVLWKFDPEQLPGKFENILISKWLPQQGVLAHPNIRLFFYQGGLQSTEEAFYYAVPLVGCPFIWDQEYNARNIQKLGAGIYLQNNNITKSSIRAVIYEVLTNKRYKDQINRLSRIYRDAPYDTLQNAVRWIEFVIRRNGTPFLRNNVCDLPWYQRYDWDIIGFLSIAAFIASVISLWVLFQLLRFYAGMSLYSRVGSSNNSYTKSKTQ
ncbi:UDP-glycosyltransferase UGT5 [Linepithema humile]|uniref:UDP-glycosyltransferase UGT5 n=1 Tax=Linepithema humile TaxID=83485 RepID=UPI00351F69D2